MNEQLFRRNFVLEAITGLSMIGFGIKSVFSSETSLHSIIGIYLFVAGIFLSAIAVRRHRGPPVDLPQETNGLTKAIEKLSGSKPFGFTCLAVSPLPMGYGGIGVIVFLLLYLVSVNSMRLSEQELMSWVFPPNYVPSTVILSPKGKHE